MIRTHSWLDDQTESLCCRDSLIAASPFIES